MMRQGRRTGDVDLEESRRRFRLELPRLPEHLRKLEPSSIPYPVSFSDRLQDDLDKIRREIAGGT
jgi:hypothetical protein